MPALYLVLEKEIPNLDSVVNGNWLLKENDDLEKLAKKLNVTPLVKSYSANPDEIAFITGRVRRRGSKHSRQEDQGSMVFRGRWATNGKGSDANAQTLILSLPNPCAR